jgi:hypothetical protein
LFLEQLVAWLGDPAHPDAEFVPPTLAALLAARLDRLGPGERAVIERASVVGKEFSAEALADLLRPSLRRVLSENLEQLIRKQLIRRDRTRLSGRQSFRFRHVLVQEAAYRSIPKRLRADLHERFAEWVEERASDVVELDELVGYHLEQAACYKQELGEGDAELAARAGERLASAGRRALWRGDTRAASGLLERALTQLRPLPLDVALQLDLAAALVDDRRRAAAIAEATAERARAENDRAGEAAARVAAAGHRAFFAADPAFGELEALARAALPLLDEAGDHSGLVRAWGALAQVAGDQGRLGEAVQAAEQALRQARLAGQPYRWLFGIELWLILGPTPADEALRRLDELLPEAPSPHTLLCRAVLLAMLGRLEEASQIGREESERARELSGVWGASASLVAEIATLAGDHERAVRFLRRFCDTLQERGSRAHLSTYAPRLGRSLCMLGHHDEAEEWAHLGHELGDEQDVQTQMLWRQVQALVHASRGEYAKANALARAAVVIGQRTESLNMPADAFCDLGTVLEVEGHPDKAASALEQALEHYARKKNLAMVAQVRLRLDELRAKARATVSRPDTKAVSLVPPLD